MPEGLCESFRSGLVAIWENAESGAVDTAKRTIAHARYSESSRDRYMGRRAFNEASMVLASLALPFLPLTSLQILLNNLIYDISEIGIPFDSADENEVVRPQAWDMKSVLRVTLVMGPLSSLFDAATFSLLRLAFWSG